MYMKTAIKRLGSALIAAALIASMSISAFAATFTDVPESHWSCAAVERAAAEKLVNGVGGGKYDPDKSVSNGEWCQMTANLLWDEIYHNEGNPWWFEATRYAHQQHWIDGTVLKSQVNYQDVKMFSDTIINTAINRYDMAQVIYNISLNEFNLTVDTTGIADDISDYRNIPTSYRTAVEYCYAAGIIVGVDSQGAFGGENPMTRGAAATVLCRLLDCKNGAWTVPERNDNAEQPSTNSAAVKDMITVTPINRSGFDYSVIVRNTYTSGKLSNGKDITDENIAAMLDELKAVFPDGTAWGDKGSGAHYYNSSSTPAPSGGGCNAWAGMTGDVLFGSGAKWTSYSNLENAKPGDLIEFKDADGVSRHWVVVQSAEEIESSRLVNGQIVPATDIQLTLCDGNNASKVSWDSEQILAAIIKGYPNSVLYSAY